MPLTLADYRDIVRGLIGRYRPASSTLFPNADIDRYLNAAQSDLILELGDFDLFKTSQTRDATSANLTAPASLLGHYTAVLVKNSTDSGRQPLIRLEAQKLDEQDPNWRVKTAQYPEAYVVQFDDAGTFTIKLYPAPTATITNGLFERWTKRPTDMSLTTDTSYVSTLFPNREARLLPYGAMRYLAHLAAGSEDNLAAKFDALWAREVEEARKQLSNLFLGTGTYGNR